MKYYYLYLLLFINYLPAHSQTIKGLVKTNEDKPVIAANIFIKGSYDGTISDTTGKFLFKTSLTGEQTIVVSFLGYKSFETTLDIQKGKEYTIQAVLIETSTRLNDVYITAGTFEAGDKKRSLQLKALDILTTANSNGNIYSALNTMPGTQIVGEEGVLFVRGGEKNESKTFVDGMLVSNPYTSKLPDMPMRGRFSPSLFSGVQFSTGGYSAEFGQALSSALILQTNPYPTKTFTSISLMPFGAGINQTIKGDSMAFFGSVNYNNMKPYFSAIPQKTQWTKEPEGIESNMMFRKKFKNGGHLKSFGAFSTSRSGIVLPDYSTVYGNRYLKLKNNNFYLNAIYTNSIFSGWSLKTGVALNYDTENFDFEHISIHTKKQAAEIRVSLQKNVTSRLSLKFGGEFSGQFYNQEFVRTDTAFKGTSKFNSPVTASFIEAEWRITDRLFARVGTRFEYASLPDEFLVSPRISFAYKTGEFSQISAAYGTFSQVPRDDYMKVANNLSSEKAAHYILNYQYTRNNRLFRIDGYYKDYKNLVRYTKVNEYNFTGLNNDGYGYARGIEVFFHDRKTFRNGEYWVSYSFLDTRKLYQDLPFLVTPTLFSKHSATAVGKYYFPKIHSQVGITYQFASGRPYELVGADSYQQLLTKDFHELSANISYLTSIFNCFTIIHVSVSNILGIDNIYGYRFVKSQQGSEYKSYPIKPAAKRFFVLAIFITLDKQYIQY